MKKLLMQFFVVLSFFAFLIPLSAASSRATFITGRCNISVNGEDAPDSFTDNDYMTFSEYENAEITISSKKEIGGIYIIFDKTPPQWTLKTEQTETFCGLQGYLHEFQKIEDEGVYSLTMSFDSTVIIADIQVLSRGDILPPAVQVWRPAEGRCDIMLLACHSDDDQLFFAGSVPDAVAKGAEMQVCYFTNHWNDHARPHELLNGLWTCGLNRYPVIGELLDTYRRDIEENALALFEEQGFDFDYMVESQVRLLRKYKPSIVLVHDINGEYGHGAHKLDCHSLRDAALLSGNPEKYPESAEEFGVWDVPKIYIHLFEENTIDFEIDKPLRYFNLRTAFEVSQKAFRCHKTQMVSSKSYGTWLLGTEDDPIVTSKDIEDYSPRKYGLWKTLVGKDVLKVDFYENITLLNGEVVHPVSEKGAEDDISSPAETMTEPPVIPTEKETVPPTQPPTEETISESQPETLPDVDEEAETTIMLISAHVTEKDPNNNHFIPVIIVVAVIATGLAGAVLVFKKQF